jgi:hypothetical protein
MFWAGLALVALLISFGGHTFLYSPLYLFAPALAMFRDQERAIYLFSLALAVLAGFGAAGFPTAWPSPAARRAVRALLALAGAAFAMFFLLWLVEATTQKLGEATEAAAFTLVIALLGAGLCALAARGLAPAPARALLVLVIAFDLFSVNWQNNVAQASPESYYSSSAILDYLQAHAGEGRVFNEFQYPLNYGDVYRVRDANGASPLVIQTYRDWLDKLPRERALALAGVRYLVTWQGGYPGGRRIGEEGDKDKRYLYELPAPLPAAAVFNDLTVEPDAAKALALLGSAEFDYRARAVIEAPLDLPPGPPRPATVVTAQPEYLDVALPGGPPGLLVLAEAYYPGWRARVDGVEAPTVRVDTHLRGVVLPADARRAEFVFVPASVRLGGALSILALIAALALTGIGVVADRRRSRALTP